MKKTILFSRLFVGLLFIFSGLIKANDPLGLSYKMQEFFELWHLTALNDFTLTFSVLMIAFEIIAGVAVILGWQFNIFSWLLLALIVFFTFLTGYAVLTGSVKECGCFGDCIKLTAGESFAKDIFLFIIITFLFINRGKISSTLKSSVAILALALTTFSSFAVQFYVLDHLPLVDCLPYKVGVTIQDEMKIPKDAIPDSTVINFVYNHNGKEVEFDAEHFPADFNDTSYTFIKRYDKLIREGNAKPKIKDFIILNRNEKDTTAEILSAEGRIYVIMSKSIEDISDQSKTMATLKSIHEKAVDENIAILAVSSDQQNLADLFEKNNLNIEVCKGDAVAIKTAARTSPTLYLLEKGRIINKWGAADLERALK